MNVTDIINKLRQQPRHGVLPGGRGAARGRVASALASQTSPRQQAPAPREIQELPAAPIESVNEQVQQLARQLANEIIAERDQMSSIARLGRTFTKFDMLNDVVSKQKETVTAGLWSDNLASLTTFHTGSTQTTSQRRYYLDVYHKQSAATGSAVQFSLAYGHAKGSGSSALGTSNDSPSRAIYSQYRQLLLNPGDSRFTTAGSGSTDHIYVINFKRNRLRERLDAGNFELPLTIISASRPLNATGSVSASRTAGTAISLIDDSSLASAAIGDSGTIYNIVSGSIDGGVFNSTAPVYYGLAYPDHGVLVLDAKMLDQQLNFQTNTGSNSEGNNHFALFHSISGSALQTAPSGDKYGFLARNSEKVTSTHYFVRIKNAEYNFSNNPSFVTGSNGEFKQTSFVNDPKVYVTTVGLYNDNRELLAVAKLSKPLLKSFSKEALIRVKLDF
tara:strand:- start:1375 stop:2712 length:1338 start_codon:yes stop_codon:yes gene_type:complete